MITHNAYANGVQSLGATIDGHRFTYGLMPPGIYQFNNSTEEHITILDGAAQINGQLYQAGQTCVVTSEAGVNIETVGCGYRCEYH
jgi:uncharacterized protein YaiE (UPF0345 family)